MKFRLHPLACSINAALVLTLAACGGGGGGEAPAAVAGSGESAAPAPALAPVLTPAPAPAPAPAVVTLTGTVMANQAVRNAVVCLDLNANSACDTDEPSSARTGADGTYTISYETSKVSAAQAAAASLIAPMVAGTATDANTTFDAADPNVGLTASAYVLRQVPGKAGQINPLTTLVAKGMLDGMTEADARSNAALQLGISAGKIDDYQGDPATDLLVQDSARWIAQVVKAALEAGVTLRVGDQNAATTASDGDLSLLSYNYSGSYLARTYPTQAKAAGTPGVRVLDSRIGRTDGSLTDPAALYNFAYLSPRGWIRCDGPWSSSNGAPNRSSYCEASESVGFTTSTDVSGRTMVSVIADMQTDQASNVINKGVSVEQLSADLGSAMFPAGSRIHRRTTFALAPSILINSLTRDGRPQAEAQTLEQLIEAKPASGVTLPAGRGTLTLGLGSGNFKNLRVAFTGVTNAISGTVQYYECDLDTTLTVTSNCGTTTTGTYSIATVNGARVMRFAGHGPTSMTNERLYVEVQNAPAVADGKWVYQAREAKMDTTSALNVSKRLNATAWAAMRAQLKL